MNLRSFLCYIWSSLNPDLLRAVTNKRNALPTENERCSRILSCYARLDYTLPSPRPTSLSCLEPPRSHLSSGLLNPINDGTQ